MTVLLAIAGLALLVLFHELAHYFAARAVGLNPFRFMLFFPPVLLRRYSAKTEWGLGLLPLGGFVSIAGMHRPRGEAIIALRAALGSGHELVGKLEQAIEVGQPPSSETAAAIAAQIVGQRKAVKELETLQRDLAPDAYWRAAPWKRMVTVAAGPFGSLLLAFILAFIFFISFQTAKLQVFSVDRGSAAAAAHLRSGDVIKEVNGAAAHSSSLVRAIDGAQGKPVKLLIERKHRLLTVLLRPRKTEGIWRIGISVSGGTSDQGHPIAAAVQSGRALWLTTSETASSLSSIASKPVGKNGAVSGPVGIVGTSSGILGHSLSYWPLIFALVSLALALTNALPIPPLDGGHFLIAFIEWLRRKPLSQRAEQLVIAWGVAFIVLVFALGFLNDLLRFN